MVWYKLQSYDFLNMDLVKSDLGHSLRIEESNLLCFSLLKKD